MTTDADRRYPGYDVLDKWNSPSYDDATRAVLSKRLHEVPPRRFLTEDEWALLDAVNARLLPQDDRTHPIPITPRIDAMLFDNQGEGFRIADLPPMREAWRLGLAALADEAVRRHGKPFAGLDAATQDALLGDVAADRVESPRWRAVADKFAKRFFSDTLLKTAAGFYYAHPDAWSEIGFGGPASPRGYVRIGIGARDPWEGKEAK